MAILSNLKQAVKSVTQTASSAYAAVDKSVFGGALPGGAPKKKVEDGVTISIAPTATMTTKEGTTIVAKQTPSGDVQVTTTTSTGKTSTTTVKPQQGITMVQTPTTSTPTTTVTQPTTTTQPTVLDKLVPSQISRPGPIFSVPRLIPTTPTPTPAPRTYIDQAIIQGISRTVKPEIESTKRFVTEVITPEAKKLGKKIKEEIIEPSIESIKKVPKKIKEEIVEPTIEVGEAGYKILTTKVPISSKYVDSKTGETVTQWEKNISVLDVGTALGTTAAKGVGAGYKFLTTKVPMSSRYVDSKTGETVTQWEKDISLLDTAKIAAGLTFMPAKFAITTIPKIAQKDYEKSVTFFGLYKDPGTYLSDVISGRETQLPFTRIKGRTARVDAPWKVTFQDVGKDEIKTVPFFKKDGEKSLIGYGAGETYTAVDVAIKTLGVGEGDLFRTYLSEETRKDLGQQGSRLKKIYLAGIGTESVGKPGILNIIDVYKSVAKAEIEKKNIDKSMPDYIKSIETQNLLVGEQEKIVPLIEKNIEEIKKQEPKIDALVKRIESNAEKQNKINERIEALNEKGQSGVTEKDKRIIENEYETLSKNFNELDKDTKTSTNELNNILNYANTLYEETKPLEKKFSQLDWERELVMAKPGTQYIIDLTKTRGELGTLEQDFFKTDPSKFERTLKGAAVITTTYIPYSIPIVREVKALGILSGGVSDVSEKKYLEGGIKAGQAGLILGLPHLLKGTSASSTYFKVDPTSTLGKGLKIGGAATGLGLVGFLGGMETYGAYKRTGDIYYSLGAALGVGAALLGPTIVKREFGLTQKRVELPAKKKTTLEYGKDPFYMTFSPEKSTMKVVTGVGVIKGKIGGKGAVEVLTKGSIAPVYRQWQIDAQAVAKKIGLTYSPKPIYIGSPYGGEVTTGVKGAIDIFGQKIKFGKLKTVKISAAQSKVDYQKAYSILRSRGMTEIKARDALRYTEPKDIIYAIKIKGGVTTGPDYRLYDWTGGQQKLTVKSDPIKFIDPVTGKNIILKTTGQKVKPELIDKFVKAPTSGQTIDEFLKSGFSVKASKFGKPSKINTLMVQLKSGERTPEFMYGKTPEQKKAISELKEIYKKGFDKNIYRDFTILSAPGKKGITTKLTESIIQKKGEKIFGLNIGGKDRTELVAAERYRYIDDKTGKIIEPPVEQLAGRGVLDSRYAVNPEDLAFKYTMMKVVQQSMVRNLKSGKISPTAYDIKIRSQQFFEEPIKKIKTYSGIKGSDKGYKSIKGILQKPDIIESTYIASKTKPPSGLLTIDSSGLGVDISGYKLTKVKKVSNIPIQIEKSTFAEELKQIDLKQGLKKVIDSSTGKSVKINYDKFGNLNTLTYLDNGKKIKIDMKKPEPIAQARINEILSQLSKIDKTKKLDISLDARKEYLDKLKEALLADKSKKTSIFSLFPTDKKAMTSLSRPEMVQPSVKPKKPDVVVQISPIQPKWGIDKDLTTDAPAPSFPKVPSITDRIKLSITSPTVLPYIKTFEPQLTYTKIDIPVEYAVPRLSPSSIKTYESMTTPTALSVYPSMTPTMSPAMSPVMSPTLSPLMSPVLSPVQAPVLAPVLSPVVAPVVAPAPIITPAPAPAPLPTPPKPIKIIQPPYIPFAALPLITTVPKRKKKKKKVVKRKGYEVLVRRKGKYELISPYAYPEEEAIAKGAKVVLKTARATFKIIPSKKPAIVTGETISPMILKEYFRAPKKTQPGVFIQKETKRITTPGEKKEITRVGIATRVAKQISGTLGRRKIKTTSNNKGLSLSTPNVFKSKIKFI